MAKDHEEQSLGDQPSIAGTGGGEDQGPQSLGDQATFAGGALDADSQSLGDQSTMGGGATDGDGAVDDSMEVVDLSARYTTEGTLGKGGMGEVLLATDTRLNRKVAIKQILGDAANSRTAVNRFLTEAQSIAALSNHPNIVDIYDYGRTADGPFLIMEYVDGGSLLDRCRAGAIPLEEAVELTCQLCSALDKAHAADIIHRDIKPANVLLTKTGIPKLTDFGLAKDEAADTGQTMAGAVLGTLDFMPPEQRRDAALTDARSDLGSLAATLYQMVTGEPPRVIDLDDVPQQLRKTLSRALKTKKDDRYQTAGEFADALQGCLAPSEPVPEVVVDLGAGECPQCHTKNEASRKFCSNGTCGGPLRVTCLGCKTEIPVWDQVCGDCGGKQSELLEEPRTKMASIQSEAEDLLKDYDFTGATKLATQLRDEPDLRLQHLRGWGDQFLKTIEREKQSQQEHTAKLLAEAEKHEQAYDYKAGIHALQQVPERLHSMSVSGHAETVKQVLHRLNQKRQEGSRLNKLIQQRLASKQLDGLDTEVRALLELYPGREDLRKLQQALANRQQKLEVVRDEAAQSAQQFLQQQNYEGCLEQLGRINSTLLTSEITQLGDDAQDRLDRSQKLRSTIKAAVQSKQWRGDSFDPYYKWLGIPKKHRPPTHYQLLGVSPDESDHTIIEDAVERQKSHVGHYRGTEFDTAAARVLYELEEAETCLLNPEMRKEYDRQLREKRWKKKKQTTGKMRGAPPSIHGGGKGFEIVPTIFKIVGILLVAFMIMAAFSFQLPWQRTGVRTAETPVLTRGSENTEKRPVPVLPKGQIAKRPEEEPALKPQPTDAGDVDQSETITAKVVRVDAGSRSLTVSYNGRTTEFDVSRAAVLLAEGSEVDLDDLSSGLSATITFNPEYDVVTRIEIRSTPPKIKNSVGMQFKLLPGGTFRMGEGDTAHQVILTKPFYLGVYEVTQSQYGRVMVSNPSHFTGGNNPVEQVSWIDAVSFCRTLSSLPEEKSAGRVYRLPTEAEWEYACRAGTDTAYGFGDDETQLSTYAWFNDNSGNTTHPVGKKRANAWGLYDMHGNVYEWCADWYGDYPNGSVTDPIGPASGSYRVYRGGSWNITARSCRSASRSSYTPDYRSNYLGFRLVLSPSVAGGE